MLCLHSSKANRLWPEAFAFTLPSSCSLVSHGIAGGETLCPVRSGKGIWIPMRIPEWGSVRPSFGGLVADPPMARMPWSCHAGCLVDSTHRRNPASASLGPLEGPLAHKPAAVQRGVFQMSPAHLARSCPSRRQRLGPRDPSGGGPGPLESEGPRGHRLSGALDGSHKGRRGLKHRGTCAAARHTGRSARHRTPGATGVHSARLPGGSPGSQSRHRRPVPGGTASPRPLCPRFWALGLLPRR